MTRMRSTCGDLIDGVWCGFSSLAGFFAEQATDTWAGGFERLRPWKIGGFVFCLLEFLGQICRI